MDDYKLYELLIEVEKLLLLIPEESRSQNWSNYIADVRNEIYDLMDKLNITGNDLY